MAALTYELSGKTTFERAPAIRSSMAVDGTMRVLDLSTTTYNRINCVVESLDETDRDGLMAFLSANSTGEIDVTITGTTYRGRLIPSAAGSWRKSNGRYEVSFTLWARAV